MLLDGIQRLLRCLVRLAVARAGRYPSVNKRKGGAKETASTPLPRTTMLGPYASPHFAGASGHMLAFCQACCPRLEIQGLWMTSSTLSTGCTRDLRLYPSLRRRAPNLYCFVVQLHKQDSPPPQNALRQFLCYSIAALPYRKCLFLHAIRFHAFASTVSCQILNETIHLFRLANGVAPGQEGG